MGESSAIEWTDATWNLWDGCDQVSPGCAHCYITRQPPFRTTGRKFVNGSTERRIYENRLMLPGTSKWRDPRFVFVNSLSDFWLQDIPNSLRDRALASMAIHHQHTYQILTKRADAALAYLNDPGLPERVGIEMIDLMAPGGRPKHLPASLWPRWPLKHVWIGVTAENQRMADERIPRLLEMIAAVRFVSYEPLLSAIDVRRWLSMLDWGIGGGESGYNARPMRADWARGLRDQHVDAGKPFHFKQWGEWGPVTRDNIGGYYLAPDGTEHRLDEDRVRDFSDGLLGRIGKKAAGRLLDGVEWNGRPAARAA